MTSFRSNQDEFLLQGYYDSNFSNYLKIHDSLLKVDDLRTLQIIDGWQVALQKIVFNYGEYDKEKGIPVVVIPTEYNVNDWLVEINVGAWKNYTHNEVNRSFDEQLMYITRKHNDISVRDNYYNCVTNVSNGVYCMDFKQPMASMIRLDVAKMLNERYIPLNQKTVSVKEILGVITDFNEFSTTDVEGEIFTFERAFKKMVLKNYPTKDSKQLFDYIPYNNDEQWNIDGNWMKWQWIMKVDEKYNILQTHIMNISPYVQSIAVGQKLFPFLGFELLDRTKDNIKGVIWKRYEQLSYIPNHAVIEDEFRYMSEGFSSITSKSELVQAMSPIANTLSGEDYFIYSENIEDTFLGDVFAPILTVIPSFITTLSDGNDMFSYEPITPIFCDLKNQSLDMFNMTMTNSSGEKLLVSAYIELKFRLKKS